jgi:uncharacterized membrane protein
VADQAYLRQPERILPNLLGAQVLLSALGALAASVALLWFGEEPLLLRVLLGVCFVTLSNVWLVTCVLGGLRQHGPVLWSFALGYAVMLALVPLCARWQEAGLLAAFLAGQAVLLLYGLRAIAAELGLTQGFDWSCVAPRSLRGDLLLAGLCYNLGIWADKLVFWFHPGTGRRVAGFFRASDVYDLPVFLAYLTIVPGMAVFLVRVETDFAERHAAFYDAIRQGAPLRRLTPLLEAMVGSVRTALMDIGWTQLGSLILCWWAGPALLRAFGLSQLHLPLFYVDVVGVLLQVLLLTLISIFFYLDRCWLVAKLTLLFAASNAAGTWATLELGPRYYGWGFVLAAGLTGSVALVLLNRTLRHLVRDTFLLQPVVAR